jgi:hypothetical protein
LAEPDRGAEAVPEAANDASRGSAARVGGFAARLGASGAFGWVLLALALAAAVLLVVADFSTISHRTIGIGACSDRVDPGVCRTYGHDSHAYALLILTPVALVMAWGAIVGRSRAASVALMALGVVVLFIALAIDLPKLDDKRNLNIRYNDVAAHTDSGFKVELTAGVLLLLAGGLALGRERAATRMAASAERRLERRRRSRAELTAMPPPGADGASTPAATGRATADDVPDSPVPDSPAAEPAPPDPPAKDGASTPGSPEPPATDAAPGSPETPSNT